MSTFLQSIITEKVLIYAIVALTVLIIVFLIYYRDTAMFHFSRWGFIFHSADVEVQHRIKSSVEEIDVDAKKKMRRGVSGLEIIAPENYEMSDAVMLLNHRSILPLICSTYENHLTRELKPDGGTAYLAEKARDVWHAVRLMAHRFPEIT
jgi:hypothetical protein